VLGIGALAAGIWSLVDVEQPVEASGPPSYSEEAVAAGVEHVYDGEFTFFVGGGVAVFDCDDDAKPDLYFAGGSNPAALYRNQSAVGGALSFAAVPAAATDVAEVTGAYPLDVDGDGMTDLAVLRLGENLLLRGLGDCRFERANEAWGVDGGEAWTTAFSATWEGSAALPALAFGNFIALDDTGGREGCSDNSLLRPRAGGSDYADPVPLSPGWCTMSILFSDWDRSGRRDLRVTNDRQYYRDGQEQLWRIVPGETPALYTQEDGWPQLQINGMGIASHDVTGDGLPELFLANMGDNKLQTLADGADGPSYDDIAFVSGVTAHRPFIGDDIMPSTAWHAEFQDVNNDGFVDLYISKGNVDAMPEFAAADPNNLLLGQPDGTFTESADAAGLLDFGRGRGAALADFNLDGMLDLVEVNRRENVKLWRNVGWGDPAQPQPMGHWVALRLRQGGPNRDGIGSWIEVDIGERTLSRELTIGGGHGGGQLGWVHFGLGDAPGARVRVQWPDGETSPWMQVAADQFATIERGVDEAIIGLQGRELEAP
jgi:hypothetical protein